MLGVDETGLLEEGCQDGGKTKGGRSRGTEARTQEQAALLQEQDHGVGQLEEPEAQATPLGNQERRLHESPASKLAQDLLIQDGAGVIGE